MPVFRSGQSPPAWCELEHFDIVELPAGGSHGFPRRGAKEKLIVAAGSCRVAFAAQTLDAEEGANLDLASAEGQFEVVRAISDCTLVRMAGRWGEQTGGSGLFSVVPADAPEDRGDPGGYPKRTRFDNHFHDCDEYWILLAGEGVVVSEHKRYQVGPGDCLATGMGHHHDFPEVFKPVKAAYFETTMRGRKRPGHLWEHAHGHAECDPERV